jgi:peptidoglycan/LPS O-acetylase OafA/YrhL
LILAGALSSGESVSAAFADWLPPQATQYQLWFLPWALVVGLVLTRAEPLLSEAPGTVRATALLLGSAALSGLSLLIADRAGLPPFFALWALYIPSVLAGALAYALRRSAAGLMLIAAGSAAIALAADAIGLHGTQQLLLGVPAAVLALCLRIPASRWSRHLGKMSMDVYLVHAAVIAILVRVFDVPTGTALCGVLAVAISVAFSATLRGLPFAGAPRLPRPLNAVRQTLL